MTDISENFRNKHLVEAVDLARELHESNPPPVLLDVRFVLDGPDGYPEYLAGHLPGAVYVDLPTDLSGPVTANGGRRPLPQAEAFQATARALGLQRLDQAIVLYDDRKGLSAARGWWVLRWAGFSNVRLLDGGLGAWRAANLPLEKGAVTLPPGAVVLNAGQAPQIDADEATRLARQGLLFDARPRDAYRGDQKGADDPRAGHIPGAINLPTPGNVGLDGRFLAAEALDARFEAAGVRRDARIGVYCGGGVTAAHEILALATRGIDAALYVGSWSAWSADLTREIATGDARG